MIWKQVDLANRAFFVHVALSVQFYRMSCRSIYRTIDNIEIDICVNKCACVRRIVLNIENSENAFDVFKNECQPIWTVSNIWRPQHTLCSVVQCMCMCMCTINWIILRKDKWIRNIIKSIAAARNSCTLFAAEFSFSFCKQFRIILSSEPECELQEGVGEKCAEMQRPFGHRSNIFCDSMWATVVAPFDANIFER